MSPIPRFHTDFRFRFWEVSWDQFPPESNWPWPHCYMAEQCKCILKSTLHVLQCLYFFQLWTIQVWVLSLLEFYILATSSIRSGFQNLFIGVFTLATFSIIWGQEPIRDTAHECNPTGMPGHWHHDWISHSDILSWHWTELTSPCHILSWLVQFKGNVTELDSKSWCWWFGFPVGQH